jgi:transitional endoplasmic reticulum ATPase
VTISFCTRSGFCFQWSPETTEANNPDTTILNSLRDALDNSPENLPLRLVYARKCEDTYAWSEALTIYRGILEKYPTHPSGHLGIARSLFFQGEISEAEVRAHGVVESFPNFAEGHLFLCRTLCSADDADYPLAARHYRIALSIDPRLADPALDRDLGDLIKDSESDGSDSPSPDQGEEHHDPFEGEDWLSAGDEVHLKSPFELGDTPSAQKDHDYDDGGFIDALKNGLDQNGLKVSDFDKPITTFSDVGGMYSLKEDLRMKIVHPIKNPQLFSAYGIQAGGSMLLYGPPGCGKSLIGEALAGEVNASFYTLGLHQLLDAGIGRAEKQLHEIFHIARMNAPSVLFLDEVDAIAGRRDTADHSRASVVNQLLKELDEISKCAEGVLVVAATSAPWLLDPAFHRAGRFGRKVCVSTPDELERADIIRVLRNRIPVTDLDSHKIAAATDGFSGAELTTIFEHAAERAIAGSIKIGCYQALTTKLILDEAERLMPVAQGWKIMAQEELERAHVASAFRELFD